MELLLRSYTTLENLPAGSLFLHGETLGLKTQYKTERGAIEAHIVGSGVLFWGDKTAPEALAKLEVIRVTVNGDFKGRISESVSLTFRQLRGVLEQLPHPAKWDYKMNGMDVAIAVMPEDFLTVTSLYNKEAPVLRKELATVRFGLNRYSLMEPFWEPVQPIIIKQIKPRF